MSRASGVVGQGVATGSGESLWWMTMALECTQSVVGCVDGSGRGQHIGHTERLGAMGSVRRKVGAKGVHHQ